MLKQRCTPGCIWYGDILPNDIVEEGYCPECGAQLLIGETLFPAPPVRRLPKFRQDCPDCGKNLHYKNYGGLLITENIDGEDRLSAECPGCSEVFSVFRRKNKYDV